MQSSQSDKPRASINNPFRQRPLLIIPSLGIALEAQPIPLSVNGGKGYGAPRRPTYKDAGNPSPAPLKPEN